MIPEMIPDDPGSTAERRSCHTLSGTSLDLAVISKASPIARATP
jgi:hypothetical protein